MSARPATTFVSLADRVQEQTGIPYALLDGRFDAIAATYRKLGELIGRQADAEKLARYADDTLEDHHRPHRRHRAATSARASITRAARAGW